MTENSMEMQMAQDKSGWSVRMGILAGRWLPLALGVAGCVLATASLAQPKEVVVATTGGVYDQALRETWFEPFSKRTGIPVKTVIATDAEQRTRAQAMFQAGNVTWDVIVNVDIIAASPQNRSFTVDMSDFCKQFETRTDLTDQACNASGVRLSYNATLLAYNGDRFKGKEPQNWADFWNTTAFPGPRALPNFGDPWRVYAAALMADGVAADKLFPLDVPRALKKLDQIKPQVQLWWKTGDQSQQGFRNGDYIIGMIWGTRAVALRKEGQPVRTSFDQAFMLADTLQLIRNSPNREGALQLLKFYLDNTDVQARFAERFSITPPSRDAIAKMNEDARKNIPTSPDAFKKIVTPDAQWINANRESMLNDWNNWIQK